MDKTIDTAPPPALISVKEACRRLGIGISHFYGLERLGKMPLEKIRLGRAIRIRADELSRWISAGCPAARQWEQMTRR